jgi:aquaporin Z
MAHFNPAVSLGFLITKHITKVQLIGLDIFFLAFISGASMNPARPLAPALISGVLNNLWLYWSATFIGTSIVAFMFRRMFVSRTQ